MGWLVDTRPTKYGRIKHWLIGSVPILMLGAFFMFMPMGETVSPAYLVIWLIGLLARLHYVADPASVLGSDDHDRV